MLSVTIVYYADCRYAKCHYAECRGALNDINMIISNVKYVKLRTLIDNC
jgi:hypothetical protein